MVDALSSAATFSGGWGVACELMFLYRTKGCEKDREREDNAFSNALTCSKSTGYASQLPCHALKHCDQSRLSLQGALKADFSVLAACHFRDKNSRSSDRPSLCVPPLAGRVVQHTDQTQHFQLKSSVLNEPVFKTKKFCICLQTDVTVLLAANRVDHTEELGHHL